MARFGLFTKSGMDEGVAEYRQTSGAVLLDVRTREEYADGHIDGSRNLPLDEIDAVLKAIPNRDTPLFVHCRSGARSGQAAAYLKKMGYRNVRNIGGILDYQGKTVR